MHSMMNRPVGVRVPENQSTEAAPTMTVVDIMRAEWVFLRYGDERGNAHDVLAVKIGDKIYLPPQPDQFTGGFRPLVKALSDQAIEKLALKDERDPANDVKPVPTSDNVDVVSGEETTG